MATATAENQGLPAAGDGHKHKKNALSDGQGRLAWILLAPTLLVIIVVAGIPVVMSTTGVVLPDQLRGRPDHRPGGRWREFVGLQNYTDIFAGPNDGHRRPTAPWTGSGTRS